MFHIFHLVYSLRSEDQVKNIALSTFKIFYFSIKILKIYLVGPRPTNKPTACVSALTPSLPSVVNADTRHIILKKIGLFVQAIPSITAVTDYTQYFVLLTSSHNPTFGCERPNSSAPLVGFNF